MLITSLKLPTHWHPAQIEIRYTSEDIAEVPFEIISRIKNTFDCCIEQNELVLLTENGRLWNTIKDLKKRGVRVRFITTNNSQRRKCSILQTIDESRRGFS